MDIIDRLGIMKKKHSAPSELGLFPYDGNLLGGVLLGIGMAVSGSCPGTTFVQAGTGNVNGVLVIIGGLIGAITFVKLQDSLKRSRAEITDSAANVEPSSSPPLHTASKTPSDIATALNISPIALLLIWVPMCLMILRLAFAQDNSLREPSTPGIIPPAYGGLLIGLAQLATILLTRHAIGASAAFQDVAQWLNSRLANEGSKRTLLTGPVMFSAGMICSAMLLKRAFYGAGSPLVERISRIAPSVAMQSLAGGWAIVLGARLARGCTSGHGISGLSKFSLPSLVSTAAMFAGGVATATVLQY
jgi:uncharacterized membrane protein YedE/YeeE